MDRDRFSEFLPSPKTAAAHEAGHIVIAHALGMSVCCAAIHDPPRERPGQAPRAGEFFHDAVPASWVLEVVGETEVLTPGGLVASGLLLLAGPMGERMLHPEAASEFNDALDHDEMHQALVYLALAVVLSCWSESSDPRGALRVVLHAPPFRRVAAVVVKLLLDDLRAPIERVGAALLRHRALARPQLRRLLRDVPRISPERAWEPARWALGLPALPAGPLPPWYRAMALEGEVRL